MTLELGNSTWLNDDDMNVYANYNGKQVELNEPFVSNRKGKKYSVYVMDENNHNVKLIHFGDRNHQHYHDKLGFYKNMDHLDKDKRQKYKKRASKITDSKGRQTFRLMWSPNYWAYNFLW